MKIRIEIDQKTLINLVKEHLQEILGELPLHTDNLSVETKSKQNYKSEWETADYRAIYEELI